MMTTVMMIMTIITTTANSDSRTCIVRPTYYTAT